LKAYYYTSIPVPWYMQSKFKVAVTKNCLKTCSVNKKWL
jgi:hypothetical protein